MTIIQRDWTFVNTLSGEFFAASPGPVHPPTPYVDIPPTPCHNCAAHAAVNRSRLPSSL